MQHIRPTGKGDPLCPLGFHPQVRWPTRCKRCFRDYKEHGNRNKELDSLRRDDSTASSPSLSSWSSRTRDEPKSDSSIGNRSWTSSSNLSSSVSNLSSSNRSSDNKSSDLSSTGFSNTSSSWTSTPNLADLKDDTNSVTVSLTLPKRKPKPDTGQNEDDYRRTAYTVRRRTSSSNLNPPISTSATVTARVSRTPERKTPEKTVTKPPERSSRTIEKTSSSDIDFMMQVKSSKPPKAPVKIKRELSPAQNAAESSSSSEEDDESVANTETTDTTIMNDNSELQEQLENLKLEFESMKVRCEKAEREKSDILLRRLASLDTTTSKTTASENLKLQQKVNELKTTVEDLRDDKKSLTLRVKELESDMEKLKSVQKVEKEAENLKAKLQAAETLCEELMDENEDMKRELRDLEDEMDEMQDNFREEQADEYTSLKKELEQTAKNCRILSFKLRKAERKLETVEVEKQEFEKKCQQLAGGKMGLDKTERIRTLESELSVANEVIKKLQKELEETKEKIKSTNDDKSLAKKKAPMLGSIGKSSSGEKISRESLTRGGSQEDPVQLMRDLKDSMEREADLREQLRYAEEEAENLRKKASRVEDDNESLVLQLKKMATKARTVRRLSPSSSRLTPEPFQEKDEGISDEEDPAELRLLLELNEQESAVLRRKVEELEGESSTLKKKCNDLQEKLTAKVENRNLLKQSAGELAKGNPIYEQKIKVYEDEINELKSKLLEKERDCERLHAEISLSQKKPKSLQKSKSLDASTETLDLKRQLQVVEQEANVLRSRNQSLESENDKLSAENKRLLLTRGTKKSSIADSSALFDMKAKVNKLEKELEEASKKIKDYENEKESTKKDLKSVPSVEFDKLKTQLSKVESENNKLNETLVRLKEEALSDIVNFYQKRTPKKPTDITTKLQLKKMVDDLESEIGEVLVALRKTEKTNKSSPQSSKEEAKKLKSEIEQLTKKLDETEKQMKEEKTKAEKELNKIQKDIKLLEDSKRIEETEKEKLKKELEDEKKNIQSEKQNNEKLKSEIESYKASKAESLKYKRELDKLQEEIKEEKKKYEEVNKQLEAAQKSEQDKTKLIKDVGEKTKKLNEYEKKNKELEDKLKKSDRLVGTKKEKIIKLEKEVEEYKNKLEAENTSKKGELESLKSEKAELLKRISNLEAESIAIKLVLDEKKSAILELESNIKEEREKVSALTSKAGSVNSIEIKKLKEELDSANKSIESFKEKLLKTEEKHKSAENALEETKSKAEKEFDELQEKASELEMDLQAERKLSERLKVAHEKEIKTKETEISSLKAKAAQSGGKKITEMKQEMQAKIDKLEMALESEKREYDELTNKYEQLEEEHVVTKAQLVRERENIQGELVASQRELVEVESELRTLRETYNSKQDSWVKEKLEFQAKMKELEEKVEQDTWALEKARLNAICEEKSSEIDTLRRENMTQVEQIECMRKENDELRRKLDDYDKVVKVQRSYSTDTSNIEKDLRETKNKLFMEEKARKSEIASIKLSYDNRVSVISNELKSSQAQLTRFKRERDTFRHMFEEAQKNLAELKANSRSRTSSGTASPVSDDEIRSQISTLEQQISCMEDELSEARLESSRLKTELVSERSAWEVKLSELNSKINELEEDRLLSTGRTKISGLKTRMELAWHKEREEQQRLVQEASTLARDLRQTLFEVERERDKERLEAKRRLEQMKKTVEEEQEENRKKLNEMQCDLLELRDAHAKLRTTNEKLRREKERSEKERDLIKQASATRRRTDQDDEKKISILIKLVDELMANASELFPAAATAPVNLTIPTPPVRRKGPKSRESSPAIDRESSEEPKGSQIQLTLQRLSKAVEELRQDQIKSEDRDRIVQARKSFGSRRAASSESENPPEAYGINNENKKIHRKGSLYRKSLSLEQTSAGVHEVKIWKNETDNEGSLTSIQSLDESYESKMMRRDPSLDSRLSGGSTQSEVITTGTDKKKKIGILGKLKKLTKSSKSIDQEGSDYGVGSANQLDQGSDTSLNVAMDSDHGSKRDLKDRLTGIFKKSGSASRGNSLERNSKPPTGAGSDRPLSRVSSTNALLRSSPAKSDASSSSSRSRPLGGVSGPSSVPLQRKTKPK